MIAAIRQMLSEATGEISMARCTLAAIALWVLLKAVAFNAMALVHGVAPVPMDATDVAMLSAAMAGKVVQNIFGEKRQGL